MPKKRALRSRVMNSVSALRVLRHYVFIYKRELRAFRPGALCRTQSFTCSNIRYLGLLFAWERLKGLNGLSADDRGRVTSADDWGGVRLQGSGSGNPKRYIHEPAILVSKRHVRKSRVQSMVAWEDLRTSSLTSASQLCGHQTVHPQGTPPAGG